jgi:hypothetical protein
LKTVIDKYINRKGGKLFACFIDLRKAFDTGIHAGIRYKLMCVASPFSLVILPVFQKR